MSSNWISLKTQSNLSLNAAVVQLHHAAQFLTRFTHAYLEKKADDSQNNLGWDGNSLISRRLDSPSWQMKLKVPQFEIEIVNNTITIPLDRLTRFQIEDKIKSELKKIGLDETEYREITHFFITKDTLDQGEPYRKPEAESLEVWTNYLTNTQLILKEISNSFEWASEIRVWPHHFDMGVYIPVTRDEENNDTQSIGLGLAIADAYWNEPYFYVNHWSKEPVNYDQLRGITGMGRWNKQDWYGLILPISDIVEEAKEAEGQYRISHDFFVEGSRISLELLGKNPEEVSLS